MSGFVAKAVNSELTWWDVCRCLNLQHVISGAYLTGLGSLAGGIISTAGGGALRFIGETRLHKVDGKLGAILVANMTVVGLCIAFAWIFGRVQAYAEGEGDGADGLGRAGRSSRACATHSQHPRSGRAEFGGCCAECGGCSGAA